MARRAVDGGAVARAGQGVDDDFGHAGVGAVGHEQDAVGE